MNSKEWRYFSLETKSPQENMAIDEALYKAKIENPSLPNTFRLYRWKPGAVSCGKHQNINNEIDVVESKNRGINVIRRITGGGAVFHDANGEITYSVVINTDDFDENNSESFVTLLLKGLQKGFNNMNLTTTYDKINCPSLFINNKKISGNAQARHKNVLLQHGTILLDYSPELMYSVLKARPDKPRNKMIESVYAHVTTLKKELTNVNISNDFVSNSVLNGFKEAFNDFKWKKSHYSEKELYHANKLIKNKYEVDDWTFKKIEVYN